MPRRLVLASASPGRLRLLRGAGFVPEVVVSGVDERAVAGADGWELVSELARRKADAVAGRPEAADAVVVAADSMVLADGKLVGKPADPAEAVQRWRAMRGASVLVLTGHAVVDTRTGRCAGEVADTVVRFGHPSDEEIDAYVATGEPLRAAGGFTLDGRSAPFVEGVEGDPSNATGLSLPLFRRLLHQLGIGLTELWGAT